MLWQESQRKVALLEAMVTALRERLQEEEGRNQELRGGRSLSGCVTMTVGLFSVYRMALWPGGICLVAIAFGG